MHAAGRKGKILSMGGYGMGVILDEYFNQTRLTASLKVKKQSRYICLKLEF